MSTALGARLLDRYAAGEATVAQLDAALVRGWIDQGEHDGAQAPTADLEQGAGS